MGKVSKFCLNCVVQSRHRYFFMGSKISDNSRRKPARMKNGKRESSRDTPIRFNFDHSSFLVVRYSFTSFSVVDSKFCSIVLEVWKPFQTTVCFEEIGYHALISAGVISAGVISEERRICTSSGASNLPR